MRIECFCGGGFDVRPLTYPNISAEYCLGGLKPTHDFCFFSCFLLENGERYRMRAHIRRKEINKEMLPARNVSETMHTISLDKDEDGKKRRNDERGKSPRRCFKDVFIVLCFLFPPPSHSDKLRPTKNISLSSDFLISLLTKINSIPAEACVEMSRAEATFQHIPKKSSTLSFLFFASFHLALERNTK
jgi:hypothetical protein